MYLRDLYLRNFRIYQEAFFEFKPQINYIYGPNAQGKTTILEAIRFLMTGHSFRTPQTADLIRKESDSFFLEANFIKFGIEQKLRIWHDGKNKKILYNNTSLHSSSGLLGLISGVLITPDDAALVKGSPHIRRHFLDLQIAQADPLYVHHITRFNKAMRQRNCLLRSQNIATIESWENEMANAAEYIIQERLKAAQELQIFGESLYQELAEEKEKLTLTYKTGIAQMNGFNQIKSHYLDLFHRYRRKEMALGSTLYGPHKDDLAMAIGQKDLRFFASEGQQRSCVTALHLAVWKRLNRQVEAPLMLIDDVGIGLDDGRKDKLFKHLENLGQVFLTSAQKPAENYLAGSNIIALDLFRNC